MEKTEEKHIIFCGGGSGGHVLPALTLINELKKKSEYRITYIGSYRGIEERICRENAVFYIPVSTGKLRRYLSIENVFDLFKFTWGVLQSFYYLGQYSKKNTLVFGVGGFVSVPPIIAAFFQGKKIYIHEQTSRVGLANKLASRFSHKVFTSFEKSHEFFPKEKTTLVGYPVRTTCFTPVQKSVRVQNDLIDFSKRDVLFLTGGGNGSQLLNETLFKSLDEFKKNYLIVHQVGTQFYEEYKPFEDEYYKVVDFLGSEIIELMKGAKVVISRAGAGTVCELMAMKKRSLFVPLKIAQKNEQYHNAIEAKQKLGSWVLEENILIRKKLSKWVEEFLMENVEISSTGNQHRESLDLLLEEIDCSFKSN